jgi:muramoyltetrapeptide carboxypeptidase
LTLVITKPKRLKKGDCLGLVAPASQTSPEKFEQVLSNIERLGFKAKLAPHVREKKGFLAGSDQQRLNDLHVMFEDDGVDGILCLRGGYGTGRLLNAINYDIIKSNPKVFIGFSDITALLSAFLVKTGLVGFHGPVGTSNYTDFTFNSLLEQITGSGYGVVPINSANTLSRNTTDFVEGEVIGGNLAIMTSLLGTPYDPDYADKIVVIEDVGEPPYRIDRMLTQLINAGKFDHASAVAFGVFEKCDKQSDDSDEPSYDQVIEERMSVLSVPLIQGLQFGHTDDNATLPFGIKARLDFKKRELKYLEKAVLA